MTDLMSRAEWTDRQAAHLAAVDERVTAHEQRQGRGIAHPVEDFLFTYYQFRPNQLRRWHPGAGVVLADAADAPHRDWPYYSTDGDEVSADIERYADQRRPLIEFVRRLMRSTLDRPARYGCFGLHEWAMVYRQQPQQVRHDAWPLRLAPDELADIVEAKPLQCTHFDAFRFFTMPARPLNTTQLHAEDRLDHEQPGCLHAGMDLYKWAYKLIPLTSSELVLACFDLARRIRYVDMRASPYDLRDLGLEPIAIETPQGRAEYAALQREFTAEAAPLRRHLLAVCDQDCDQASEHGSDVLKAPSRVGDRD
ncbi:3-methyladenine DNA glycosylase [Epidermidibacterium keratini]|uniref:3-methyladenine DNA glycosylase n=1 Tax=Epidermidibacterium keratini TaxID=1891644 RepID=UPI001CEF8A7A|nr:3-methyladenine DNA glycosylase [Epidermidibacterium keratini]